MRSFAPYNRAKTRAIKNEVAAHKETWSAHDALFLQYSSLLLRNDRLDADRPHHAPIFVLQQMAVVHKNLVSDVVHQLWHFRFFTRIKVFIPGTSRQGVNASR